MRIALDAMGGDQAPHDLVRGAVQFARKNGETEVIVVGQRPAIEAELSQLRNTPANLSIEHAPEVIGMSDKISALRERPEDSMNVTARLVKDGKADAMVLCGNTGCSVAAAQLHLRRIPGVKRAGILTPLPSPAQTAKTWIVDAGANAVGKPEHLAQFGVMGSIFLSRYFGITPKVGVLNIGSEEGKGDELTDGTLALLKQEASIDLVGNVEGNDIYKGTADLVVCDGFTGNVVLKTSEGLASFLGNIIRQEIMRGLFTKLGGLLVKPAFKRVHTRTHWSLVGGCPLLGVNGVCLIGHGRSNDTAVCSALEQAQRCVETDIMTGLREHLAGPGANAAAS